MSFLDILNRYANLLLAAITLGYVVLTRRMVMEMRHAREEETHPQLVAVLTPFAALNVKIRIQNAGRGAALDVEAAITLEPPLDIKPTHWRHPALFPGAHEDLLLPGELRSLEELAQTHRSVLVSLKCRDVFDRPHDADFEYDFKAQKEGWYKAHHLIPPEDSPLQLQAIRKEIKGIRDVLEKAERDRTLNELLVRYRRKTKPRKPRGRSSRGPR